MGFIKLIAGGVIGGMIGIALWGAIVHLTGYEIGIIAWALGVLVGVAIAAAAGPERGTGAAVFAGFFAFVTILGGKGVVAWVQSQQMMAEGGIAADADISEEFLVSCVADEIVLEYEWEGWSLDYPEGADADFPDSEGDYPAEVWAEAETRWLEMSPTEQAELRSMMEFGADAAYYFAFVLVFLFSFGFIDLLWIGLAVSSAYRIVKNPPDPHAGAEAVLDPADPLTTLGMVPLPPQEQTDPLSDPPTMEATPAPDAPFLPGAMLDEEPFEAEGDDGYRQAG